MTMMGPGIRVTRSLARLVAPRSIRYNGVRSRFSYAMGMTDLPLQGIAIGQLLQDTTNKFPDKEAFVFSECGTRYTYDQLLEKCDRFAAGLISLGAKPGDHVGIWAPNCPEWILTQYAAARAGLVLVNVNPAYRTDEAEFALKKVGVKFLICPESFNTSMYYDMLCEICPELATETSPYLHCERLPDLKCVILIDNKKQPGTLKLDDVVSLSTPDIRGQVLDMQIKTQFDSPFNIQFTSGTTGSPKGATLSHHNIVNNAYFVGHRLRYNQSSVICSPVPLYHCFGCVMGSLASVIYGTTMVIPAPLPNPQATAKAVMKEKCNSLYGTPTMFIDILNVPDFREYDFTSLKTGIMAGSPCPTELMKDVIDKMNMTNVTIAYGTTENSPVTFMTSPNDSMHRKVESIGRPMPHTEVKVVDLDGNIVRHGEKGELLVRGACVMIGYYGDEEKTRQVIGPERWYSTGDIVSLDKNGYAKIEGRIKDMLIRGGENVYPVEIEQILHTHPDIKDAQVFGVPDKRLGEEACACIKLQPGSDLTEDAIKDFCKTKMAHFKVPRYIEFVEEYPMTVTAKVQKYKLRQMMITKHNL